MASSSISGMASRFIRLITSDLAAVNQRLMSPYFGDLAEWLCKAFWQPIEKRQLVVPPVVSSGQPSHRGLGFALLPTLAAEGRGLSRQAPTSVPPFRDSMPFLGCPPNVARITSSHWRKAGFDRGYVKTQIRSVSRGAKTIADLKQIEYGAF
jgi:hypothetical protein